MQADTLNQSSIAMEDPMYTPKFVHPTADATEPDGSIFTVCDWVIPEFANKPFLPSSTQTDDVASPDMSTDPLKRKHHVPHGEIQAILARRNQQFEAAIARKMGTSIEVTSGDAGEGDDWTQRHTTMKNTNNDEDTDEDIEIDGTQDESTATNVLDTDTTLQGKDLYPVYRRCDDVRNEKACGSINAVKYLFKYIYKGHDRASIVMRDVSKADDDVDDQAVQRCKSGKGKVWQQRKRDMSGQVSRIVSAHPFEGVRYYIRVLLNHVTGATSYVDLRTIDGVTLPTFHEAAERRGLLESDNTLDECLTERALFATILLMGKDIKTFPLPPIMDAYDDAIGTAREVYKEEIIEPAAEDVALKDSLNKEQRAAYDKILSAVDTDQGGLFFEDGPGGTGKTYLYRVLLASMTKRQSVEALDNSMHDIMGRLGLPFGGKTIVFGGDFRQGSSGCFLATDVLLWESMPHLKLVNNMRTKHDPLFAEYLLHVGNGTEDTNSDGDIHLPDEVCVPYSGSDSDLDNLIDFVFPNLNKNMSDSTYITSKAILSLRNDEVDMINVKMIDRFQGEHMVYHSFDNAMDDPHNYYPPEFLNTLTPNGLPPHVLKLKIGCPIILLRNIDPANGLCNGTGLAIRGFQRNSIDAEIVL
ncbi:hypothetical protein ZEAMMB73_Zm00001d051300, partial [Zea mays]